jgi:O-antigen/teichoic acid export membrane protein
MPEESPLKRIAKGALIVTIGLFFTKLLGYIIRMFSARLGPENYGVISLGLAIFGILTTVCALGMESGLFGLSSTSKKEEKISIFQSATSITLIASILAGFLLFILSDYIAITWFNNENWGIMLKILAVILPFNVTKTIFQVLMRTFELVKYDIYSRIIENLSRTIIIITLFFIGLNVIGVTLAYLISIIITFLFLMIIIQKKICKLIDSNTKIINKELIVYSVPLLFNNFIIQLMSWIDTIMLGLLKNSSDVGLYNTAIPTAGLISTNTRSIMTIFLPVIGSLYISNQIEKLKEVFKSTIKWTLIINSIIFINLVIFSKEVLSIMFGEVYSVASSSLIILSSFFLFSSLSDGPRDILLMFKETKKIFRITLIGLIENIILSYILITKIGINGAAIATGISFLTITILFYFNAYKKINIHPFNKEIFFLFFVIIISSILGVIIKNNFVIESIYGLIIGGLITTSIYFLLLIILRFIKINEIKSLYQLIKIKN